MSSEELVYYDRNCPNNCNKGYIFVQALRKRVPCTHCSDYRRNLLNGSQVEDAFIGTSHKENIEQELGLKVRFCGKHTYDFDSIFRGNSTSYMIPESLTAVKSELDEILSGIALGVVPKYSMLFNLGSKVFEENFINPIVLRSYLHGISVTPLMTVNLISSLRSKSESSEYYDEETYNTYTGYLNCSMSVVVIDEGTTRSGVDIVKGYVASRARYGNPTVVLTHSNRREIMYDFATSEDDFDLFSPKLVSIKYSKVGSSTVVSNESIEDVQSIPSKDSGDSYLGQPSINFHSMSSQKNLI